MKKVKVFFPLVEAGLGHMMTCEAVVEMFRRKYQNENVEIISYDFYDRGHGKRLKAFGEMLKQSVWHYTRGNNYGKFISSTGELFTPKISSYAVMRMRVPGSFKECMFFMDHIKPDIIFSTHWATNYYAMHMKERPYTIMYCPDATLNKLFSYPADLTLISMEPGYELGMKQKRFNENNFKLVPFCIRNSAFTLVDTKEESREKIGIEKDKFTVVLAEGGYGNGCMKKIVELILAEDLPFTIIPICGKNKELYEYFRTLESKGNTTFLPIGFTKFMFDYLNAADIFCGKSGNMIAEPTFFGVPSIITSNSTMIERDIAKYYTDYVKSAIVEFDAGKVVEMLKQFYEDRSLLRPYQDAAINHHDSYGAEKTADMIWEIVKEKFPEVINNKK